jgi:hypothetical protein
MLILFSFILIIVVLDSIKYQAASCYSLILIGCLGTHVYRPRNIRSPKNLRYTQINTLAS